MKLILQKIALIIIALVILDLSLGVLFKKYIFNKTFSGESGGSLNFLLSNKKNVDYLILGTSRAVHQIDPKLLTNLNGIGYNAGINGTGGILYNTVLLDICLNNKIKPKSIILQLDVMNFCNKVSSYNSKLIYLYPFYDQSKLLRKYIKLDGIKESILATSYLYQFNGKFLNIIYNYFKKTEVKDNNGFDPIFQVIDTTAGFKSEAIKINLNWQNNNFVALNDINALCDSNDIDLIVVLPPFFQNCYYFENTDKEFTSFLSSKYPNISLINLSDIFSQENKDLMNFENWKDNNHLNATGASKFSKTLNKMLMAHSKTIK